MEIKMNFRELGRMAYDLRKDTVDMILSGNGGHIGGDMSETSSPFLLTISMTARSESTWGYKSGQAHRSVNTHTTRLAAGIRMDAHSRARIIFVINDFLFFISVRSNFYCSVSAFIFLRMMK